CDNFWPKTDMNALGPAGDQTIAHVLDRVALQVSPGQVGAQFLSKSRKPDRPEVATLIDKPFAASVSWVQHRLRGSWDKAHPMEPSDDGLVKGLRPGRVDASMPSSPRQRSGTHARLHSQASTTSASSEWTSLYLKLPG